jgi:AraC family transcriptional regulator, transcriptional activator of pobA
MEKIETIEEFYQRKFDWIPENIKKEIGHFSKWTIAEIAYSLGFTD